MSEAEKALICAQLVGLLERLARHQGHGDHLRSAELLTVGPEAKVPYPKGKAL